MLVLPPLGLNRYAKQEVISKGWEWIKKIPQIRSKLLGKSLKVAPIA
jgi:hypothetical protein